MAKDYWLTLAAGLQVLGFAMLAMDTTSSAAEGLSEKTLWVPRHLRVKQMLLRSSLNKS